MGAYTEVNANLSASVLTAPAGQNATGGLIFSLEYTLPRAASATASASLQNFIQSIGLLGAKYYYAGADRVTLFIQTFDTSRLVITQLEMFNANGQVYDLRGYPQFQLTETSNATHFIIEFRPSAIRQDSAFYHNGPHGVNVSFLFTAAASRRQMASQEDGFVTVNGINVRGDDAGLQSSAGAQSTSTTTSSTSAASLIVPLAAVIGVVALIAAAVVIAVVKRSMSARSTATVATEEGPQSVDEAQV